MAMEAYTTRACGVQLSPGEIPRSGPPEQAPSAVREPEAFSGSVGVRRCLRTLGRPIGGGLHRGLHQSSRAVSPGEADGGFAIEAVKIAARLGDLSRREKANTMGDRRMGAGNRGVGGNHQRRSGAPRKPRWSLVAVMCWFEMVRSRAAVRITGGVSEAAGGANPSLREEWCRLFKAGSRTSVMSSLVFGTFGVCAG
ncbi:hypothetical protein Bca4012_035745 [Brassica carinata]